MIKVNADRISNANDSIYGLIFRSTMSGLNVAFCSTDKNKLLRLQPEIEQLILDIDDVDWDAYCDKYNLLYADDAGSENILYLDNAYASVETADAVYTINIVGDNSFRF